MLEAINARTNNFNVIMKIMNESKNKRLKEGEGAERKSFYSSILLILMGFVPLLDKHNEQDGY